MAVVNSWLLYQQDAVKLKISKSKQMGLSEFKTQIGFSLMKSGKKFFLKEDGCLLAQWKLNIRKEPEMLLHQFPKKIFT